MALRTPARVRSSTATAGSGTYTLGTGGTEPTAAGWRTFGDAVTDGDLADADQVLYCVADLTTTPGVLEIGLGTYDHAAKTLTRTVYQPAGTAVSWGAGTRDVFVIDPVQLAVLTLGDQTVAGEKTFSDKLRAVLGGTPFGADASTPIVAQNSGSAGDNARLAIIGGASGQSELSLGDTAGQYQGRVIYSHSGETMGFYTSGALREQLSASWARFGVEVQDGAGVPYEKFPSGGRLLWGTNSIPSGYAIVASLADKTILLTSTASEIDDQGGSWTVSGLSAGSTALSISQMPAHSHDAVDGVSSGFIVSFTAATGVSHPGAGSGLASSGATAAEGGGGAHSHTVSQDGSWRPSYYKAGWIQKS